MNMKSFFLGVIVGFVLAFASIIVIGIVGQGVDETDMVQYLEQPVSYEDKTETSFKVFQVLGKSALAKEISSKKLKWYDGNTVMLLGENFYSEQVVTVKNPQRVGTYSYTSKSDMPMTVPVIEVEMK